MLAAVAKLSLARTEQPSLTSGAAALAGEAPANQSQLTAAKLKQQEHAASIAAVNEDDLDRTRNANNGKRKQAVLDNALLGHEDDGEDSAKHEKVVHVYKCIDYKAQYEAYKRKCVAKCREESEMAKLWAAKGSKRREGFQFFMKAWFYDSSVFRFWNRHIQFVHNLNRAYNRYIGCVWRSWQTTTAVALEQPRSENSMVKGH